MKFSEKWLREWVDPELSSNQLAHSLTMAGHEVQSVVAQGTGIEDVVIARVLQVEKHPNADRLNVCKVDPGDGSSIEIVCGASNVYVGMKTPLASPGVQLPNGMKLRKSKIRGVVSNGMLCSAVELGLGEESDGILELAADAPTGQSLAEYLNVPDTVIDVDLTPNRGDCFSVLGLARDVAAVSGVPFRAPVSATIDATIDDQHAVELVDPAACPRFAGRVIRNLDPKAKSPLWMVEYLRRSGIRSIHPVVDVTNFVMLELGQPLHAYDLARLQGPIRPRFANKGEKVTLLDEREIEPTDDTVIIADDTGPIGIAGIMGGLSTAVQAATTDIFFEAAFWPPEVMAGRARSYAMHTDASLRFERGVDPDGQARAIDRATELLLQISGGDAGPLTDVSHAQVLPSSSTITLRHARLSKVLGVEIEMEKVTSILTGLGLESELIDGGWTVISPSFRFDIEIEEDLIEEVARIYGYDAIPEVTAIAETPLATVSETTVDLEKVADALVVRDYQEVISYSFVDAETDALMSGEESKLVLANPISTEMSVMRGSLLGGMLSVAAANLARQQERVRLFEIGKSFHGTLNAPVEIVRVAGLALGNARAEQWDDSGQGVDFFDIKSDLEGLIAMSGCAVDFTFVAGTHPALQAGQSAKVMRGGVEVGVLGKLNPRVAKQLGVKKDVFLFELNADLVFASKVPAATEVSKFPAIRRDIAVVVDDDIPVSQIVSAVESAASELIRNVVIFDIYRGSGIEAGRKSIALGLILQETSRTLTDEDADSAMDAAVRKLQQEFAARLRE
jgi:phenylalanyl-tRNA synthetase beta chain